MSHLRENEALSIAQCLVVIWGGVAIVIGIAAFCLWWRA